VAGYQWRVISGWVVLVGMGWGSVGGNRYGERSDGQSAG